MKRLLTAVFAVGALAAAAPAFAQPAQFRPVAWTSIGARQAELERRIDMGVRNGGLTRREAEGLRGEFRGILRLEANYRRHGLTPAERADLDRRFDRLSARIYVQRHDDQRRF